MPLTHPSPHRGEGKGEGGGVDIEYGPALAGFGIDFLNSNSF